MRSVADFSSSWAFPSLSYVSFHLSMSRNITISTQAPSEAEAQCAELARGGKARPLPHFPVIPLTFPSQVYAAGSEDMDTLTFSAPILYRHLTFSEAKKQPISEINLQAALAGLDMDMSQVHFFHRLPSK